MRKIWLIRHGKPYFENGLVTCLGAGSDPDISDEGVMQAENAATFFKGESVDGIYSSPLLRAVHTAEIISDGYEKYSGRRLEVVKLEGAKELSMGIWEGRDFIDIRDNYPSIKEEFEGRPSIKAPGGEHWHAAALRMKAAILSTEGNCIVVAHSAINRSLLCLLTGREYSKNYEIPQNYCGISLITEDGGELKPEFMGRISNDLYSIYIHPNEKSFVVKGGGEASENK